MDESARLTERSDDDDNVGALWSIGWSCCSRSVASKRRRRSPGAGARWCVTASSGAAMARPWLVRVLSAGRAGCCDEARRLLGDAIVLAQSGWWRAWPLQSRAWLNWLTRDIDEAESDLAEIERLAPELAEGQFLAAEVQAMAAVAIETEQWETAMQTVADSVRQLRVEHGDPVVHWQTMTAAWLRLRAAAEWAQERGETGSTGLHSSRR